MKKFNLNNIKIISDPFPVMIYDNFISDEENDKIYEGIIRFNKFDTEKWGGRKQIRKETDNFNNLLKENQTIQNVYNFFDDKEMFEYFYKKFEEISIKSTHNYKTDYKNILFKKDYSKNYLKSFFNKFLLGKTISYLEMDFSQADKGYFREPHHDKNTRLINFLIYFNDLNESDGGALDIYGYKSLPDVLKAQPDEKLLEKKLKFIPQKKQLIIFLSNPVSIHGVSKIVSEKKRIFAYGSYTLENKVIWKLN